MRLSLLYGQPLLVAAPFIPRILYLVTTPWHVRLSTAWLVLVCQCLCTALWLLTPTTLCLYLTLATLYYCLFFVLLLSPAASLSSFRRVARIIFATLLLIYGDKMVCRTRLLCCLYLPLVYTVIIGVCVCVYTYIFDVAKIYLHVCCAPVCFSHQSSVVWAKSNQGVVAVSARFASACWEHSRHALINVHH